MRVYLFWIIIDCNKVVWWTFLFHLERDENDILYWLRRTFLNLKTDLLLAFENGDITTLWQTEFSVMDAQNMDEMIQNNYSNSSYSKQSI